MKTPLFKSFPHMLHGGDYNPEQWIETPEIWDEDMRLMRLSKCNTFSVGIFSWAELEPEEGKFDFSFLDTIIDKIYKNGGRVFLATPSGARPRWLAEKYPEVLQTTPRQEKMLFGSRHNHCPTSPIYREKVRIIDEKLAERYKDHPAVLMWHISNEFGNAGECHCELCQSAFRKWLKNKYNNDLDKLNHEYWSRFWSQKYTSWDQIHSPSPIGESDAIHALNIDWMRFVTDQMVDFIKNEVSAVRKYSSLPVTANFMTYFDGLNYAKLKEPIDIISWDSYSYWHSPKGDVDAAIDAAFNHDWFRSMKPNQPFLLMESTPQGANWHKYSKLRRPGVLRLSSAQAVAHGSDSVMYFQWRKSRGGQEKFHGAVVDHYGKEDTRAFREVSGVGEMLSKLDGIVGTTPKCEVAIVFDTENRWALDNLCGMIKGEKGYVEECKMHYLSLWKSAVNVDIIDMHADFSKYRLVIAPMLYAVDENAISSIEKYVSGGGTFIGTYLTATANENDLCYLGGRPANILKDVFGIWAEEFDTLYPEDKNTFEFGKKSYPVISYADISHSRGASVLAKYTSDYYSGFGMLFKNNYKNGSAYYIGCRSNQDFYDDFYSGIISELGIKTALPALPYGVSAHTRSSDDAEYLFIENYNDCDREIDIPFDCEDTESGKTLSGKTVIGARSVMILKKSV